MKRNRWIFIPLSIIIYICLGTVYSWSVFKKPLEELYSINSAQSNLPYMFFLFFYAIFVFIAGNFIEKYGPRLIMSVGGILVGIGWILSGSVNNIFIMTVTYGVIAGSGVGIAYGVPIAVCSEWYPRNKGLVMGTILTGFGLSPFITAPLASYLISEYNPLLAFRILGIIFLIIITVCSFPFAFPTKPVEEKRQKSSSFKINKLFHTKRFWGLWSCYVIGTLIGLMMIGITSPVGEELLELSPQSTAFMISIFALFNALGRPLFGWITDRFTPVYAAIFSFILISGAGSMMLLAERSVMIYFIAFAVFWLNLGGWLAIAPTATAMFYSSKNYSKIYGIIFTAYGVGAILGGIISGNIKKIFGSYYYVFYPILGLAVIGIIFAILLLRKETDKSIREKM